MLVEAGRESSVFVDPADPTATPIEWQGRWRTLEQAWRFVADCRELHDRLERSSTSRGCCATRSAIAVLSTIGAVLSSILVAYGFARFRFPGRNVLFFVLLGTIILPVPGDAPPARTSSSRGSAGTGRGCR